MYKEISMNENQINQSDCHCDSCIYLKAYGIGLILHYCYKIHCNHYLEQKL